MLIEVVTAMNTDVMEKCGTAIFRSASASGALQVIKDSFLFLLFVCPSKRSRAAYNPKNTVVMSCFKALNLLDTVKSNFILLFFLSFIDLHRAHPSAGQSKQRATHLFHFGKHLFKYFHVGFQRCATLSYGWIYRPAHSNPCIKHAVLH